MYIICIIYYIYFEIEKNRIQYTFEDITPHSIITIIIIIIIIIIITIIIIIFIITTITTIIVTTITIMKYKYYVAIFTE